MSKALSPEPTVHPTAQIKDSTLGRYTEVGERVQMVECELGDYSYVCNDSDLMYATLGKFVSVASHVRVNPSNHPMWRPTLHHFTYRSEQYGFGPDDEGLFDWRREHSVTIGHDAWLGHGVIVLPGVSIGIGAVIGAGAVVTKDVEPYSVMVGTPARKVRERFEREVQEALLKIAWWEWGHEQVAAALDDFRGRNIGDFIAKYS